VNEAKKSNNSLNKVNKFPSDKKSTNIISNVNITINYTKHLTSIITIQRWFRKASNKHNPKNTLKTLLKRTKMNVLKNYGYNNDCDLNLNNDIDLNIKITSNNEVIDIKEKSNRNLLEDSSYKDNNKRDGNRDNKDNNRDINTNINTNLTNNIISNNNNKINKIIDINIDKPEFKNCIQKESAFDIIPNNNLPTQPPYLPNLPNSPNNIYVNTSIKSKYSFY